MEYAAAEVIAAFREHEAMMLVGGYAPDRLKAAIDALEKVMIERRKPQAA